MDYSFAICMWLLGFLTALTVIGFAVTIVLVLEILNRVP